MAPIDVPTEWTTLQESPTGDGGKVEPPAGEADDEERRYLEIVERELGDLPE